MVGGCLRCLSGFFTYSSVLLLGLCLHDVEASNCQRAIQKKVGDTVELPSCLPTERVTDAKWKYGELTIADKDNRISKKHQFKGRLYLNPTNFSLTVRELTLQDSGEFSFLSEADDQQRDTVIITLQVHEPITKQPVLTSNFTWHSSNESCTVLLECAGTSDSDVNYTWAVKNQTRGGSRLQYILRPHDGDTKFTCTVSNLVSEMSASETVKCSNETKGPEKYVILTAAIGGGCLIVLGLVIAVVVFYCKQSSPGSDSNDLTVYADITEVGIEDETLSTMKPCSVYETIDNRVTPVTPVTPGPQTVYDKIQLSRVRKASVSPYQEIS